MFKRVAVVSVACVALAVALPAGARADDASLKAEVVKQEKKLAPDNAAFVKAFKHVTKSNAGKAKSITTKLISDLSSYRAAIAAQHASTSSAAKGRTKLLAALAKQRSGLKSLRTALTKYRSGSSEASVKKSLAAASRKFAAGQKDAKAAVELLGITGTHT